MANDRITLNLGKLSSKGEKRREFRARFVRAGLVRAAGGGLSNIEITEDALSSGYSKGLFNKLAVFVDHAGWFEHPSVRNLAGVTLDSIYSDDGDKPYMYALVALNDEYREGDSAYIRIQ